VATGNGLTDIRTPDHLIGSGSAADQYPSSIGKY
jgi:hypothetical protein